MNDQNHLTGTTFTTGIHGGYSLVSSDLKLDAARPEFTFIREARYDARLVDATGKVVLRSRGTASRFAFNTANLSSGVHFMHVNVEGTGSRVQRYALAEGL